MRQVERFLGLLREPGQRLDLFVRHAPEAFAQRVANLLAGAFVARVLLHLVVVLVVQRDAPLPEAVLAQLIPVAALAAVPEAGKVFPHAHGADGRMDDGLDRGEPVQQRHPHETGRPGLGHEAGHKVVHRNFVLHREDLRLEALLVEEGGRLEDGGRQGEHLAQEIAQLPVY